MTSSYSPARRGLLVGAAAALALGAGLALPADAQTRAASGSIEIVLGGGPGGTPDVIFRQVARVFNETGIVDLPFAVQNRTGGSWAVSANHVLGRAGDENLLYVVAQPVFITPVTQGITPPWHTQLTPIAMFVQGDLIIVTQPDGPYHTLTDLLEAAGAEPFAVTVNGGQAGSSAQMAMALLGNVADVEFNYVPFEHAPAAIAAFLGGNAEATILAPFEAVPLIEAGRVRPVAILNTERRTEPELADIPTAREQGVDALWGQIWGISGPPGMDPELARWWSERFAELVNSDAWRAVTADSLLRSDFVGIDGAGALLEELFQQHLEVMQTLGLSRL
jgi:putative tricarboxylic transport membrane protein